MEVDDTLIENFAESIRESADQIGKDLTDPGDDWMACWFAAAEKVPNQELDEGEVGFICIGVDSSTLMNDEAKDKMCEALPQMMLECKTHIAAFISSTWYVFPEDDWPKEMKELATQVRPGQHPWRKEGLHLMVVPEGDHPIRMWNAEIHRDDRDVPYLQEWEEFEPKDKDRHYQGRFYEALCKAVKREP